MSIYTGAALRTFRRARGISYKALSALSGVAASSICEAEHGQGLLRDSVRERLENALNRIESLRVALLPAKLDMADVTALQAALDAFERGDFAVAAKNAKRPELPDPLVVTF